jgi:copper transport protein
VTLAGTLAAIGICVFAQVAHDGTGTRAEERLLRRAVLAAALFGIAGSFGWLAVDMAQISGRGLSGVTDSDSVRIAMRDGTYASAVIRCMGLAYLAYVASARWRAPTTGALVGFGAVLSCAWCVITGHPASHGPHLLVHAMMCLHLAAGSVWFGGLIALAIVMRHRRRRGDLAGGAAVVGRFSRLMTATVGVLLLGGVAIAIAFVDGFGSLVTTSYGLVLLGKVALVLALLAVAGFNNRRLVPAVQAGGGEGWAMLRRSVAVEQAAVVAVIALTAVLVNLDPHG